jgi:type II secretion system protein I
VTGRPRPATEAGFTLLETLVALAILGIVLTTVFGVIGSGLRAAHRDEDRLLLGLVAQNLLVRSRLDLTTTDGPRHGDIGGGLVWRIESEPYTVPDDILPPLPDPNANRDLAPLGSKTDKESESGTSDAAKPYGDDKPAFGSEQMDQNAAAPDGSAGADIGTGQTGSGLGQGRGGDKAQKEPLRLRLVRVTVEKGGQHFELTGLAAEPRRDRSSLL